MSRWDKNQMILQDGEEKYPGFLKFFLCSYKWYKHNDKSSILNKWGEGAKQEDCTYGNFAKIAITWRFG